MFMLSIPQMDFFANLFVAKRVHAGKFGHDVVAVALASEILTCYCV